MAHVYCIRMCCRTIVNSSQQTVPAVQDVQNFIPTNGLCCTGPLKLHSNKQSVLHRTFEPPYQRTVPAVQTSETASQRPVSAVQGYISTLPAVDRPEAFGQHANAEIAFRIEEAASLLDGLIGLQPSIQGATHAAGREQDVLQIAQEVIEQVTGC